MKKIRTRYIYVFIIIGAVLLSVVLLTTFHLMVFREYTVSQSSSSWWLGSDLEYGVDANFVCRYSKYPIEPVRSGNEHHVLPANQCWVSAGGGTRGNITSQSNRWGTVLSTKQTWSYPKFTMATIFPNLLPSQELTFGFEGPGAEVWFMLTGTGDKPKLTASLQSAHIDISLALPNSWNTSYNGYAIHVYKDFVEYYVNGNLVAIGYTTKMWHDTPTHDRIMSYPPYAIFYVFGEQVVNIGKNTLVWDIATTETAFGEGSDGNPSRVYPLYLANSFERLGATQKSSGYTVTKGSVMSHPVPLYGFSSETLYFMADKSGMLDTELLTQSGNWRTHDSLQVKANTFASYNIEINAVAMRIKFTPSEYPTKIVEAEMICRG